jgi:hypothetical protein
MGSIVSYCLSVCLSVRGVVAIQGPGVARTRTRKVTSNERILDVLQMGELNMQS